MIEKIKTLDLVNMNEKDSQNLLTELLLQNDDELKECINTIVDGIDYYDTEIESIDELSVSYKTIFNNDRIKKLMEELLEVYGKEI
jgi:Tol biopolymer transport system component